MPNLILVVEDDANLRQSIVEILEDEEYDVRAAEDVQGALDLADKFTFDLVITDVRLPKKTDGVDGFSLLKKRLPELKCIVITGYSDDDASLRAIKSQVDDWICKPFEIEGLLGAVERVLDPAAASSKYLKVLKGIPKRLVSAVAGLFRVDKTSALRASREKAFLGIYTAIKSSYVNSRTANRLFSILYSHERQFLGLVSEPDKTKNEALDQVYKDVFDRLDSLAKSTGQVIQEGHIPATEFRVLFTAVQRGKISPEEFQMAPTLRSHKSAELDSSPALQALRKLMWGDTSE